MAYPVDFTCDYGDGKRSRGYALLAILFFLKALLLIVHFIVAYVIALVAFIAQWLGYWVVLFTGKLPGGFFNIILKAYALFNRLTAWLLALTDQFPPLGLDAPDYPAQTTAEPPGATNRILALLGIFFYPKALLLLPHLIVLFVLAIGFYFVWLISIFAILFTGKLPEGMFNYMVGFTRWQTRTNAWLAGLTDAYPPFSLT